MESLLGSNWRDATIDEKLDVLPPLWGELRDEFARLAPSYPQPGASSVKDPFPEEQRMVQAILEVVVPNTSDESLPPVAPEPSTLRCAKCGRKPRPDENLDDEWRAGLDGLGELRVFCPECWEREFGANDAERDLEAGGVI